jgi:hypothetical protein
MARDWRRIGFGVPHVQDVGAAVHDPTPFNSQSEPTWFVGTDGSLWFLTVPFAPPCTQVAAPGDLTRVAVAPDGRIWCADVRGGLWTMQSGSWSKIDTAPDGVKDVGVSADSTVWLVMTNGRYYTIVPGGAPQFIGVFISMDAITGVARPDDVNPFGVAWGVSPTFGPGAVCRCATVNGWSDTNGRDVRDLSVTSAGVVWMVKANGAIATTTDGVTQFSTGGTAFTRVAAGISGLAWAVASDGTAWVWDNPMSTPTPVTPPPPPPPPPPPQGGPPTITVSASGGGLGTRFRVSGLGFVRRAVVTIRGSRVGDGEIHEFFWTTTADPDGIVRFDIDLPCVPGLVIHFSANDGRHNPADVTDRLWSNTVPATCPAG